MISRISVCVFLAGGSFVHTAHATLERGALRNGRNCGCNHTTPAVLFGYPQATIEWEGVMGLEVGQAIVIEGREGFETITVRYHMEGTHPQLGRLTADLDPDRPSPVGYLVENEEGTGFPATHVTYVNVLMTASSMPGVVLRNMEVLTIYNENTETWDPTVNEVYDLNGVVSFEDASDPGAPVGEFWGDGNGILINSLPAVSEWGMVVLVLLLLTAVTIVVGRRRRTVNV